MQGLAGTYRYRGRQAVGYMNWLPVEHPYIQRLVGCRVITDTGIGLL